MPPTAFIPSSTCFSIDLILIIQTPASAIFDINPTEDFGSNEVGRFLADTTGERSTGGGAVEMMGEVVGWGEDKHYGIVMEG